MRSDDHVATARTGRIFNAGRRGAEATEQLLADSGVDWTSPSLVDDGTPFSRAPLRSRRSRP